MANKKASVKQLLTALAEERGIDVTDIEKIKGTGVIGRLEEGAGFGEAFTETGKEKVAGLKQAFSKKGIKKLGRKAYGSFFSGDDIFSAYMRGRINKKDKEDSDEEPSKTSGDGDTAFTRVIAKESMMIPGMARDMNVMRQNIQKLVKLWSSKDDIKAAKGKPYTQGADDFFMRSDQAEAELEAARLKDSKKETSPTLEKEEKEGGLIDSIMSMFGSGFMKAIRTIFNPKMLMKVFSKVFLPITIIGTLFSGIKDGFKKYQETGSFSEAIISGLGGMLEFLTFGLFGEDTIKKLFESISNFFAPITDTISEIFTGIKDFFVKMFGGQVRVEDKTPAKMDEVKPSMKESKPASELEPKTQEPSSQTPQTSTPTPVSSGTSEPKIVEKVGGEQIKLPTGVTYDPIGGEYSYKGITFSANDQKEIETIKKAIDDKKIIEFQTTVGNIGRVTKSFNGATGEMSLLPPKQTDVSPSPVAEPMGSTAVSASGGTSSGGGGGGGVSASGGESGGSVSASGGDAGGEVGATPTTPSGESVNQASSDVAEGQRMESSADQGSVINSPTTNNTSTSQDQTRPKAADVFDSDLASILATT